MKLHCLAIQGPDNGSATLKLIKKVAAFGNYNNVLAQFAYATKGGVKLIADAMSAELSDWQHVRKRWLISIDFGLTEPEALEQLLELPNSEVRIPYGNEVIRNRLKPVRCFHAKSMLFYTNNIGSAPTGIYIGSANMTVSGLCYGHENAMAVAWTRFGNNDNIIAKKLLLEASLTENIYANSSVLNNELLSRYQRTRRARQIKSEDNTPQVNKIVSFSDQHELRISFSEAAILSTANNFWVESGYIVKNRGSHEEGNQIDLPRGASAFFDFTIAVHDRNTHIGDIEIEYRRHRAAYPLRLGNNYMEKLTLPVPGLAGPASYENTVLLFTKQINGSYKLDVRPSGSGKVLAWLRKSKDQRSRFEMRSGRQFGVFD